MILKLYPIRMFYFFIQTMQKKSFLLFFITLLHATDELREIQFDRMSRHIHTLLEGDGSSCFISRAWAKDQNNVLLTNWMNFINRKLQNIGIKTYYDINEHRGLQNSIHGFMNEIGNVSMVLILLTPEYKKSAQERSYVYDEIHRIKEKNPRYRFILLSGTPATSTPEEFMPLREKIYYDATDERGSTNLNKLLNCLCELLLPIRDNLLTSNIKPVTAERIKTYIEAFMNAESLPKAKPILPIDCQNVFMCFFRFPNSRVNEYKSKTQKHKLEGIIEGEIKSCIKHLKKTDQEILDFLIEDYPHLTLDFITHIRQEIELSKSNSDELLRKSARKE